MFSSPSASSRRRVKHSGGEKQSAEQDEERVAVRGCGGGRLIDAWRTLKSGVGHLDGGEERRRVSAARALHLLGDPAEPLVTITLVKVVFGYKISLLLFFKYGLAAIFSNYSVWR